MTIKLDKQGMSADGSTHSEAIIALARDMAKLSVAGFTPVVNSIGGTPDADNIILGVGTAFANIAATGSNLADKTTTEAAWGTVIDAASEIVAKANECAAALGLPQITDSLGGTTPDGTAGAVTVSVTGAATGVQAVECNVARLAINRAIYDAALLVNKCLVATGKAEIDWSTYAGAAGFTYRDTIPAFVNDGGTAADPGVTKAAMDAALVLWANDLDTLAEALAAAYVFGAAGATVV